MKRSVLMATIRGFGWPLTYVSLKKLVWDCYSTVSKILHARV